MRSDPYLGRASLPPLRGSVFNNPEAVLSTVAFGSLDRMQDGLRPAVLDDVIFHAKCHFTFRN
jgi:hypothetical protein